MPKINVYVSDSLAEAMKHYDIPISRVCQLALINEISRKLPLPLLTPAVHTVLHLAAVEAEQLGHKYIGTEHLLLGLLAEENGIAAQELRRLDVADTLRTRLRDVMTSTNYTTPSNQIVDKHGKILGFLTVNAEGETQIVDEQGNLVRLALDSDGNPRVIGANDTNTLS
jgi:ATP-dependent Clp protease ATP-binding subunit ClpA